MKIIIIRNKDISDMMTGMLKSFTKGIAEYTEHFGYDSDFDYRGCKLLFCIEINEMGFCSFINDFMMKAYESSHEAFKGSVGSIIITSVTELYTKRVAQDVIFKSNLMGLSYIGHPVVEAIEGYKNFRTWQKTINKALKGICLEICEKQGNRFRKFSNKKFGAKTPKIVALHASHHETSNTLMLWDKIKDKLSCDNLVEHHVENGSIVDCKGCGFTTCNHYAKQKSCFYGGLVVETILPAIEEADIVIWLCPNYNDAVSANITALINRLTVLYRRMTFYEKKFYGVIVSGNSGSDSVASQLIGALNINKGFILPSNFAIMANANDPGEILRVEGIDTKIDEFCNDIKKNFEI